MPNAECATYAPKLFGLVVRMPKRKKTSLHVTAMLRMIKMMMIQVIRDIF
jgi:hypothetical protein